MKRPESKKQAKKRNKSLQITGNDEGSVQTLTHEGGNEDAN